MDILKRISAYKAESEKLAWTGTFTEYLELLKQDPTPAMTAHARVYEMIESFGVVEDGGARKKYKFFEQEIFGLDRAVEKLVEEYFHSAARRLDVRKRILLLMGPVSGGKSTIVTMLKRGLEQFSRTDERCRLCDKRMSDARGSASSDSEGASSGGREGAWRPN